MRIIICEAGVEYRIAKDKKIDSPEKAYEAVKLISQSDTECFTVLMLNTKLGLIEADIISTGTLNSSIVHPREVFRTAITKNAAHIILAHNHPSGDLTPSFADLQITKQLIEAGKIVDIDIYDHIIVGGDKYLSMREQGMATFS